MVGNLADRHSLQDWTLALSAVHSFKFLSQRQVLEC
jgi:hypothetical protein